MLIVAKTRSTYHTVNRKRVSQRLRRACRKPRRRTRSRRRSIRLGCLNSLFNAYLSLGNHAFSGDILHSLPCRSPLGCGVVGCHRSRANSSPRARASGATFIVYCGSVSIIASAKPILVQNPGLHLRSPPSQRCTKRIRGVASLASPRLTQRRR